MERVGRATRQRPDREGSGERVGRRTSQSLAISEILRDVSRSTRYARSGQAHSQAASPL
jgi:hypothetical protein